MLDLSIAGPEWAGWILRRWGKSKDHTLHAPTGERFSPEEILSLREWIGTANHWQVRARTLSEMELDDLERDTLHDAIAILERRAGSRARFSYTSSNRRWARAR